MKTKIQSRTTEKRKVRIQIKDLPKDMKVSREEMQTIMGGDLLRTAISGSSLTFPQWGIGSVGQSGGGCGCGCG